MASENKNGFDLTRESLEQKIDEVGKKSGPQKAEEMEMLQDLQNENLLKQAKQEEEKNSSKTLSEKIIQNFERPSPSPHPQQNQNPMPLLPGDGMSK